MLLIIMSTKQSIVSRTNVGNFIYDAVCVTSHIYTDNAYHLLPTYADGHYKVNEYYLIVTNI